jgi:steroid delta-isomerase-like uncharacterized protein
MTVDRDDPEAVVRELYRAINVPEWEAFAEVIDPNVEWTYISSETTETDRNAIVDGFRDFVAAFPDFGVEIADLVVRDGTVFIEWAAHGTNLGELAGHPPTGRRFTRRGAAVAEVENGRIVRYRDYYDRARMFSQIDRMDMLCPEKP